MKLVRCTRCGSNDLFEQNGVAVCSYCRSRFIPQADDHAPPASVISVATDIDELLQRCVADPANRRRYANLILDLDPTNQSALQYLR
ncbi:hypothetical protein FXB39_10205 [Nocardioides sp. BGMRC 2183]|nr:hypothetical protein FXB39_10205 [Nocardioides sp. BGMRC 2183]